MVDVTASYSPKNFLLKALNNYKTFPLLTARFCTLADPGIYPQIYHRAPCPTVLILRGPNKLKKGGRWGRVVSNFTKGQTFSSFMTTKCFLGYSHNAGSPSCILQKRPSTPFQLGQEENIPRNLVERRAYWFVFKITRVYSIPTGRGGIGWWTLL